MFDVLGVISVILLAAMLLGRIIDGLVSLKSWCSRFVNDWDITCRRVGHIEATTDKIMRKLEEPPVNPTPTNAG